MENNKSDIEVLKLCPDNKDDLCQLASNLINILRTPRTLIRKSDRENAGLILAWGRKIMKFGGCLGFNQLSGIDCIEALYKYEEVDFIKDMSQYKNIADCLVLGKYLMISCLESEMKNYILLRIVRNVSHWISEDVESFLCELWKLRDEIPLTTQVLEELIQHFPFCLEQFLMNVVERVVSVNSHNNIDKILNLELLSFCELCASSSEIFQIVLSILHEFLLISNVHENVVYFISMFFGNVEKCCRKGTFIELFPLDIRLYVTCMQFKPTSYHDTFFDPDFTKTNVLNLLSHFIKSNKRVGGALLSYYPEWLLHILNYSMHCGIFVLVPGNKEDRERNETYLKFILLSL